MTFDLNDSDVKITLAPKESFLDLLNNSFSKNHTLDVETFQPPKILYAETSDARYITLTLNRYVTDVDTTDFSLSDSLSVQDAYAIANKIILDVSTLPSNSTPTVTINGTITDSSLATWNGYVNQDIVNGSNITAIDGSSPKIIAAEYDNLYNVTLFYSEPIDVSTLDEDDIKPFFRRDVTLGVNFDDTTVKRITNIVTTNDGLSSVLTFDRKLNLDGELEMVGLIRDKVGIAMPYHLISLRDSIPPSMSFAKTINTTLIEIKFTEDLDPSSVDSSDFAISDNIAVNGVTVLDDVVVLYTSTFLGDATPTITLSGSVEDHTGNVANSGTVKASDAIAPSLNSLLITSNNDNTTFAKSGDEITLVLVANEPVSYVDGTIFETIPQITGSNNDLNASVTITDTTSNGYPTFAITIVDDAGNTKTITRSDITGTDVR